MLKLVKKFWNDEQGLELSEYAVMIALILAIAITAITLVGDRIETIFGDLLTYLGG